MGREGPPTSPDAKPWERQPGESWPAFEAFQKYLHLGGQRSTRAVSRELRKGRAVVETWCRGNDWVNRVDAFYRWVAEEARAKQSDEAADALKRHLQEVRAVQQIKMAMVQEFARRTKEDPNWMRFLDPWQFSRVSIALSRALAIDVEVERRTLGIRDVGPDEGAGAALKEQGRQLVLTGWQPSEEELKRLKDSRPSP